MIGYLMYFLLANAYEVAIRVNFLQLYSYSHLTDEQFDSIMTGDAALGDFIPQEKVTAEKQE